MVTHMLVEWRFGVFISTVLKADGQLTPTVATKDSAGRICPCGFLIVPPGFSLSMYKGSFFHATNPLMAASGEKGKY